MKNHIKELLIRFNQNKPNKPCHSPHANETLTHGTKVQHDDTPNESPSLDKTITNRIQAIIGSLLCCARAVGNE